MEVDNEYPVQRLKNSHIRVKSLSEDQLNGEW